MSTTTTLPFAGGELSSFDPLDNSTIESSNTSTFRGGGFARCSIECVGFGTGFTSPKWTAAPTFWFHDWILLAAPTNNFYGDQVTAALLNSGQHVLQLVTHSNSNGITMNLIINTLQGGVMTNVGTITLSAGLTEIDIELVAGGSGSVNVYIAGTNRLSVSGLNHSDFGGVDQIFGSGVGWISGYGTAAFHSEIICDTVSHIGDGLVTIAEDTPSIVNIDWFGPVTNINEIVLNDSASVTSNAANQISTYYKNGSSLGTYNVLGIFVGVRAQLTSGSSTNLQVCLRTNGTNYFSPTIALNSGFQACCASWTTNPFTGSAWAPGSAAIIEAGMKSIA